MRGLGAAAVQEKSPLGAPNMSIALVAFLDTSTMFNVDTLSRFEAFGLEGFTYTSWNNKFCTDSYFTNLHPAKV